MHETEKRAAEIDVKAATINAEAARIQTLVDEDARSARTSQMLSRFDRTDDSDLEARAWADRARRRGEIASEMTSELEAIRASAQRLQSLAAESRDERLSESSG
jgi:hypothetical protein